MLAIGLIETNYEECRAVNLKVRRGSTRTYEIEDGDDAE